jgi:hypothetical protein
MPLLGECSDREVRSLYSPPDAKQPLVLNGQITLMNNMDKIVIKKSPGYF